MHIDVLDPVGARVTGVALGDTGPELAGRLRALLALHGFLALPGQDLDDEAFVAFLRSFGDLAFTEGETAVEGFADLNVISNVGRETPPRSTFHVDTSYVRRPPAYTALRAVHIPTQGGATQFTNQYRAYESLPADLLGRLRGRTLTHVVTGVELDSVTETSAEHPVFRPHPLSGRTALYLTTPARCTEISGLDRTESEGIVGRLFAHSTRPDNVYDHRWSPGDVVIWDNGGVLHRGDHADVVGDRVMHRGMVASYGRC